MGYGEAITSVASFSGSSRETAVGGANRRLAKGSCLSFGAAAFLGEEVSGEEEEGVVDAKDVGEEDEELASAGYDTEG